ncbi:MAG TPA: transketolase C-terminal domain-containing protein [Jiangellaceae bacterium]|nr:transketolase C-terminal domain-containing protein [Jiangellaceae bacterium]
MPSMTFTAAIDAALGDAMGQDGRVVVLGEDVRMLRRDLFVRFGPDRVRDTPISEAALLGAGLGAAMAGLRPVVEITFVDFIGVAFDVLLNHVAKVTAFSGGRWQVPLVVRSACGGGYGDGGQHEQALWGLLSGIPGLAVVVPSTPADAAGLLLGALDHQGPVMFLEHKLLSEVWLDYLGGTHRPSVDFAVPAAGARGEVPQPFEPTTLGRAAVRREGDDLAIVSIGVGVHLAVEAASQLADEEVEAAVLDLRSVAPLDRDAVLGLARRTGRVLVVDEDYQRGGLSGEVAAVLAESDVSARFGRVTTESTIPYALALEEETLPNVPRILAAARGLLSRSAGPGV